MGGLIKWLKKEGTSRTRRRESAPLHLFGRSEKKRKPNDQDTYRESIARFTRFRDQQRLSMGANELSAYHSIASETPDYSVQNTTPTVQRQPSYRRSTGPLKGRIQTVVEEGNCTINQNGHRSKKISVQFHLGESTDETDLSVNQRNSRHSMPAITSKTYKRGTRRTQNLMESRLIREEAIEEFEDEHCTHSSSVNEEEQSSYRSPPMKFYRQNQNPYPSISETSSLSAATDVQPFRGKCPEKPKRLLLNSKQSRKLLTEAHFTGAYRNFEIQSPYYSDSSSVFSTVDKPTPSTDNESYVNRENSSPLEHYHVAINKHGDEVEYALPCVDNPDYQRRQELPNCFTSDDSILAGEVFQEDPEQCVRIVNENFEMISNTSISIHEHSFDTRRKNGRVMITDLDKSTESADTLDELEIMSRSQRANELNTQMRLPNRVLQFHETMQCADIICLISEFNSMGKMEAKIETPLHFEWGVFKNSNVTVRKYADLPSDDTTIDFTIIAETAIIRDAEFLRKIRHPNVINLMAIAFEPFRRLALIMEPTKYSLNHHLFIKNEQLDLIEVVTVVRRIAGAVSYLQEFGICHSNISSHAILVGENVTHVKLTSFELAVPYKCDIKEEVELREKQKLKRTPSIRSKHSPKQSLNSEQKIERYKKITTEKNSTKNVTESNYCVPFIREISTKYFPYTTEYRRKLAIYNYQAPELLSQTEPFVFPTKQSDTYALTLLLWECLNQCIPFVIYDEVKLDELLKTNYPLKYLPIVEEERCQRFHEILERGLKREPDTRIDLDKMISKLDAIEVEIQRENEKDQNMVKCCCLKLQNGKNSQRRSIQKNTHDESIEKMTPDRSTSKLFSLITSPKPSSSAAFPTNSVEKSPLNNVTNNTFYNSILDFNKLLSPRHDSNDQRSSTLKKRRKFTPTKNNKLNVRDLFGDDTANDELKATSVSRQISEPISYGRPSNEFNQAFTKSAIFRELEDSNEQEPEKSSTETIKKKIEQPFGPKEINNQDDTELKQLNTNNSSYQFIIDDYELPQELIARNNKIRRCTWLSSDQVNGSMQCEPLSAASSNLQQKINDTLPTLNESNESNKRMNVNIKIVHKQLSPQKSMIQNDTIKSDCSTLSANSGACSDDSFSVKSRIKFFRSLECQPVQRRTPNKSKINISRRSEMSFYEAKKAIEKAQRHTYPSSNHPVPNFNQQLIKEIGEITADIKDCLSKNRYLNEKKVNDTEINEDEINNLLNAEFSHTDDSVQLLIDDLLNQKSLIDETTNEETEKRNSVRETVQKFESSMRNEKNDQSFSMQKVENKLLNEKIFNIETKPDVKKAAAFFSNKIDEVTDEKVEDVIRISAPMEVENEDAVQILPEFTDTCSETENQSQTLIKRTFYQESIISGTNVEVPELQTLLANSPTVTTAHSTIRKSSLTTRVTLNMRKSRRRSSDAGVIPHNINGGDVISSPHLTEIRHSICGSPAPILIRTNSVDATSGRKLEQISCERYASSMMMSNDQLQTSVSSVLTGIYGKKIQSIEDLYIDDDFGGIGLAANMKLMTNSTDSLDNINFDLISTHIFEQTSESTMTTNTTNTNTDMKAIEPADENNTTDK